MNMNRCSADRGDVTSQFCKPWLHRSHPAFFVVYAGFAIAFIWVLVEVLWGGRPMVTGGGYRYINAVGSQVQWSIPAGIIGVGLVIGLFRRSFNFHRDIFLISRLHFNFWFRLGLWFWFRLCIG